MFKSLKFGLIVLVFFAQISVVVAQEKDEKYPWEATFNTGLNSDGWEAHFGIVWKPIPYVGLSASIGFNSEIKEISDWDWIFDDDLYDDYYDSDDDDYCSRFVFKSSLILNSPRLFRIKSDEIDFHLFVHPGITLSPGASGSKNADWLYWHINAGITATVEQRYTLSLGYGYTTFNLFDGNPRTHHGYSPSDHTHSVTLTAGYRF